jgi:NAD(P)-dependent dehydrogenase (short-subunit alcohol dehydrogenase family)
MLLVKLDVQDLQFERMNPFDGTMAYAQNKRQQVIMTEKWAEMYKSTGIHFSSMHPGNEQAMTEFYQQSVDQLFQKELNHTFEPRQENQTHFVNGHTKNRKFWNICLQFQTLPKLIRSNCHIRW